MTSTITYGTCRCCSREIYFNSLIRSEKSGNPAALNVDDSSIHRCIQRTMTDEDRILAATRYIQWLNGHLKTAQLVLQREDKA